jgi:hypothetical protein
MSAPIDEIIEQTAGEAPEIKTNEDQSVNPYPEKAEPIDVLLKELQEHPEIGAKLHGALLSK